MFRIILAPIFFTMVFGGSPLKTCESSIGHVVNASMTGSKIEHGKYILNRGTNAGVDINFVTEKKVNDIKAFAKIIMNGMELSSQLPNLDGCKVLKCPLKKGGPYLYTITMPVESFYPTIESVATLQLRDENEDIIACITVPIKII